MTPLDLLAVALGGTVVGFVITWRLLASAAHARADGLFRQWQASAAKQATRQALLHAGEDTKAELGRELDGKLPSMPFAPADVRFVGHPVPLVVFDGHSALRARHSDYLRQVVLITDLGFGSDPDDAMLVEACIKARRVRWETLRLRPDQDGPEPTG